MYALLRAAAQAEDRRPHGCRGLFLIMAREPALQLAGRSGPASQGTASLVFGVFGPFLVIVGIVYFIRGRSDPPAR